LRSCRSLSAAPRTASSRSARSACAAAADCGGGGGCDDGGGGCHGVGGAAAASSPAETPSACASDASFRLCVPLSDGASRPAPAACDAGAAP